MDDRGIESVTIDNDGCNLNTTIRGIGFKGSMLDDFEPDSSQRGEAARRFQLLVGGGLCGYRLDLDLPVTFCDGDSGDGRLTLLQVQLHLGGPAANGGVDSETLRLALVVGEASFAAHKNPGSFEDGLAALHQLLPAGAFLKCCFTCQYSDYSIFGQPLFGGLYCFHNIRDEYLAMHSKREWMTLYGRERGLVQETWLCSDFFRRAGGTGYRG